MAKANQSTYLFSGSLAEFVYQPTSLTYYYLTNWFCGSTSLGKAMSLLSLPYQKITTPILKMAGKELVTDLKVEEKTLYAQTFFSYGSQKSLHAQPQLKVNYLKLMNPIAYFNTSRIIYSQAQWIAHPDQVVQQAKDLAEKIPTIERSDPNLVLTNEVWPNVLAIGFLSEFFNQYLISQAKKQKILIDNYIAREISNKDWFFQSLTDQYLVKTGKLTFENYLKNYGLRGDKDYELTYPRWYEIPQEIKDRIDQAKIIPPTLSMDVSLDKNLKKFVNTAVQLQIMRSVAKKKSLFWIDLLRAELIEKGQIPSRHKSDHKAKRKISQQLLKNKRSQPLLSGKGTPVSQGQVTGPSLFVEDNYLEVPSGTIGIFPNSSPQFAPQFPKCAGLIFLVGGQTSHGAIVAREYGIPALLDSKAETIKNGSQLSINGGSGEWKILI